MSEHENPIEDLEAIDADDIKGGLPTHHLRTVDAAQVAATESASSRSANPAKAFVENQLG